jgi:hypothetical protein
MADETYSLFSTDALVVTTDAEATPVRRYWSYVAPGVRLIRSAMLRPLKPEAERRTGKMAA